jgi:hypothetical protein
MVTKPRGRRAVVTPPTDAEVETVLRAWMAGKYPDGWKCVVVTPVPVVGGPYAALAVQPLTPLRVSVSAPTQRPCARRRGAG